jgi:hypothetical protein
MTVTVTYRMTVDVRMKWHYRMAVLVTDSTSLWNGRRFSGKYGKYSRIAVTAISIGRP